MSSWQRPTANNPCDHEAAEVIAGKHHPKFPYGYGYMRYCWKCGWVFWHADNRPT